MKPSGWSGSHHAVLHYLATVGADRDAEGRFLIGGEGGVVTFMGFGQDAVVGPDATYFVQGQPIGLAWGLQQTSYGLAVTVIM